MYKKTISKNGVLNILFWLLAITTFIALLTSCSGLQQPKDNGGSSPDPEFTILPAPADETGQSEQPNENESTGQESEQSSSDQSSEEKAEPEPLSMEDDLKLGELQVDMTKQTLEELIKAKLTDSKSDNSLGFKSETLIYDDGTEIQLVDDKIYSISVTSPDYPTPRGLRVGDTAEKVKELYGEPTAIEEDGLWIYSSRGYDLFYITIKDNTVAAIK